MNCWSDYAKGSEAERNEWFSCSLGLCWICFSKLVLPHILCVWAHAFLAYIKYDKLLWNLSWRRADQFIANSKYSLHSRCYLFYQSIRIWPMQVWHIIPYGNATCTQPLCPNASVFSNDSNTIQKPAHVAMKLYCGWFVTDLESNLQQIKYLKTFFCICSFTLFELWKIFRTDTTKLQQYIVRSKYEVYWLCSKCNPMDWTIFISLLYGKQEQVKW